MKINLFQKTYFSVLHNTLVFGSFFIVMINSPYYLQSRLYLLQGLL